MCLAQGHNAVTPVRLQPTTPPSSVKHYTTELPRVVVLNIYPIKEFKMDPKLCNLEKRNDNSNIKDPVTKGKFTINSY